MPAVNAAVVTSYDEPPHYLPFDLPDADDHDHELVDVVAVGLHPRVRSGASGSHYTSTGVLPLVPGIDGVARRKDGSLVYFVADDELTGPMAEQTVVDVRRTVPLPPGADVHRVAAAMNPAMSSWVALRRRISFQPGQSVLVLGASGNAGAMAVQVAQHLGAGRVVAAGRSLDRLAELGADEVVPLADPDALGAAAGDVDVVIDYLWGAPAERAMVALLTARPDRSKALDWIQIGSIAGPDITLPSALLRAANLRILGNGQGAVSTRGYLAELPGLVDEIDRGTFRITARAVPLSDVEAIWLQPDTPGERIVLTP
ncbi:MAG: 2-haloacrylate reductase [Nocardioidaceae bacterium]|nr:2-haloacrylate reductase [Nocardioidaceae bacterium]